MISRYHDIFPLFIVFGYIDPSAGQVYNSVSPIISLILGAITGFFLTTFHIIFKFIISIFQFFRRLKNGSSGKKSLRA